MPTSTPLLKVSGLTKHFALTQGVFGSRHNVVKAVDGVSFEIARGETLGLVGESGCGKSTLGKLVLRLATPSAGSIEFEGTNLSKLPESAIRPLRRKMQIVFQDPYESLNPKMTVLDIISEPLIIHGLFKGGRKKRVLQLLDQVGLRPEALSKYPHEFSGGQRQRIGIARALAVEPSFIVCDEAVSALDVTIQAQIVNLLQDLQAKLGLTYLFISHDLMVVKHISTRVAVMYLGKIVEIGPADELYENPKHPYTQALLSAVPSVDKSKRRERIALQGEIPSPINAPSGCQFHPRCPKAVKICGEIEPLPIAIGDSWKVACHLYP